MKKSYTIGRTPKELSAAVEIMIRNDFFDLEHFHAKHGGTEGHSFALRLSEETLEDTIFMDITAGERTTLTYTCSSEDESIPGLLAQLNQKISEVLDNAEYKEEIERLSEEKPQEAQEPEPAQRHDRSRSSACRTLQLVQIDPADLEDHVRRDPAHRAVLGHPGRNEHISLFFILRDLSADHDLFRCLFLL